MKEIHSLKELETTLWKLSRINQHVLKNGLTLYGIQLDDGSILCPFGETWKYYSALEVKR